MPPALQERSSYAHWCGGVFLITEVEALNPTLEAPLSSPLALSMIQARLSDDLTISHSGQRLRLVAGGALAGVADDALSSSLASLSYEEGMSLTLARDPPPGCGDDHVTAINLTRPIDPVLPPPRQPPRPSCLAPAASPQQPRPHGHYSPHTAVLSTIAGRSSRGGGGTLQGDRQVSGRERRDYCALHWWPMLP